MLHSQAFIPAYLLHRRPYRDTSALIDLLTPEHGRISLVARGARATKSSLRSVLQAFVPLLVSCSGKTDLLTLRSAETQGIGYTLVGKALFSGMYLNELLVRLLHRFDPHPGLYHAYEIALEGLQRATAIEPILRQFEKQLLKELGYALLLDKETSTGQPVVPDRWYRYEIGQGMVVTEADSRHSIVFSGASLLALHHDAYDNEAQLRDAKRLMRLSLAALLGDKPLKSRSLFL